MCLIIVEETCVNSTHERSSKLSQRHMDFVKGLANQLTPFLELACGVLGVKQIISPSSMAMVLANKEQLL